MNIKPGMLLKIKAHRPIIGWVKGTQEMSYFVPGTVMMFFEKEETELNFYYWCLHGEDKVCFTFLCSIGIPDVFEEAGL